MIEKTDTVLLLRSVMKMSISLNHLDEVIEDNKYYKFRFKKEASRWSSMMDIHTKELMGALTDENSELLMEIYNSLESSLDKVQLGLGTSKTALFCYYVLLKSAINDIEKMDDRRQIYAKILEIPTKTVLKTIENQYRFIISTKDSNEKDYTNVVSFLDDLGEQIMITDKENEDNKNN
tara:strand:+ start:2220 stop:2753 length:534 start_codon:yes stop_codon:yes gene_type:complete